MGQRIAMITATTSKTYYYFTHGRGAKYWDQHVCVSVCLLTYQKTHPNFTKFFLHVSVAMAQSFSRDSTLCTSSLDGVMFSQNRAYVAHGKAHGRAMSFSGRQHRHGASALPLCIASRWPTSLGRKPCRTHSLAVEANDVLRSGAKSAILDCLVVITVRMNSTGTTSKAV